MEHEKNCIRLRDRVVNMVFTGDPDKAPTIVPDPPPPQDPAPTPICPLVDLHPDPEDDWVGDKPKPKDYEWFTKPFDGKDYCEPTHPVPEYVEGETVYEMPEWPNMEWPGWDRYNAQQAVKAAKAAEFTEEKREAQKHARLARVEMIAEKVANSYRTLRTDTDAPGMQFLRAKLLETKHAPRDDRATPGPGTMKGESVDTYLMRRAEEERKFDGLMDPADLVEERERWAREADAELARLAAESAARKSPGFFIAEHDGYQQSVPTD